MEELAILSVAQTATVNTKKHGKQSNMTSPKDKIPQLPNQRY